MIYLKRFGEVRLRFQQPDSSWSEVVEHVDEQISAREAFTHAAFGSNNGIPLVPKLRSISNNRRQYSTLGGLRCSW
jgi:mediator of RNA polymerase II transcription subunit 16